ncbi:MAG: ADP-ribosylglycohydrolase family protein [Candidatus Sumerlaeota bacterium]|nr:ADP-ribosylglycohydrolase family protein [Candidatus Sumerlaeota bacterium]
MIPVDRAVGSILMMAIGDAMGAAMDGLKPGHIQQIYGGVVEDFVDPLLAWREKPHRWRLRGAHTCHTQHALMIEETLLDHSGWNARTFAEWLLAFSDAAPELEYGVHRGTAREFRNSVLRMREGGDPLACGAPSPGPEAAARMSPVGLWHDEDAAGLIEASLECALMTHCDSRAALGAAAVAAAVAALARQATARKLDAPAVAQEICDTVRRAQERLEAFLRERHLPVAFEPPYPISAFNQPFAPVCVPAAIYRALSARSAREGLTAAINGGHSAGAAGAITGAMLGARFGAEAIPEEWRRGLLAAETMAVRGEALALKQKDASRWEDLYTIEYEISVRELRERAALIRAKEQEENRRLEKQKEHSRLLAAVPSKAPAAAKIAAKPRKEKMKERPAAAAKSQPGFRDTSRIKKERKEREKQRDREKTQKRRRDVRSDFMARGDLALWKKED